MNKIIEWAKQNKVVAGIAIFFLALILLPIISIILSTITPQYSSQPYYPDKDYYSVEMSDSSYDSYDFDFLPDNLLTREKTTSDFETKTELEIKEGRLEIKSENGEQDFEILNKLVKENKGYVEESKKNETPSLLYITAQVRVPVEEFDKFVEKVQSVFVVENFELNNYKINIEEQIDELAIIKKSLEDYNFLREEALKMENGEERIDLLSKITREMQNLARQQQTLEREIGGKEKESNMATITLVFNQKLKANLWPEDLGNLFNERMNWAIDTIADTTISLLGNSFVLFIKVVEYIIYVVIIILPISFAWNVAKKIRKN